MRRLAWCAAALVVACGGTAKTEPGPLDRFHMPTGLAVDEGRLLVASSNADLLYDDATGGSVLALDPSSLDTVRVVGAVNVRSFAGDLAVANELGAAGSPSSLAVFATRGSNTLNVLRVGASAPVLSCERCGIPITGTYGDPLPAAVACGGGRARAFVSYLSAQHGAAWVSEVDLSPGSVGTVRTMSVGAGPVRGFAYDPTHDRLYLAGLATGSPTPLRWIELAGCTVGAAAGAGACSIGQATFPSLPAGIELHSIALAHPFPGAPQRAYLTARLYDVASAAVAGGRTTDYGGLLLVIDLLESSRGGVQPQVVRALSIGRGAQDVRVLPARAGQRDVVVALAVGDGELWIYDDETLAVSVFGRPSASGATGAPVLGHDPYGLAVDPDLVGTMGRVYVGSWRDSFVTPIDVPLDAPDRASFAGGAQRRITGGTP